MPTACRARQHPLFEEQLWMTSRAPLFSILEQDWLFWLILELHTLYEQPKLCFGCAGPSESSCYPKGRLLIYSWVSCTVVVSRHLWDLLPVMRPAQNPNSVRPNSDFALGPSRAALELAFFYSSLYSGFPRVLLQRTYLVWHDQSRARCCGTRWYILWWSGNKRKVIIKLALLSSRFSGCPW